MKNQISYFPNDRLPDAKFSVLIPTWNNLPHLRLIIESIRKNSRFKHQILIHVNQGSDGTLEWVKEQKLGFTYSEENVGVCYAFNAVASLANAGYLLLVDDDNYLLPDWDFYLWEEVEQIGHSNFCISGTKIEPRKTFNPCVIAPKYFGSDPKNFQERDLLDQYQSFDFADWNGSSWYPLLVHKSSWDLVGGLSTEFSPGMYSDPDFMMKLWQAGVRYFKGVSKSRSYHFISKSVKRVKKNNGRKQFLKKWGISNSTFRTEYLRMGSVFNGSLNEPEDGVKLKIKNLKDRMKLILSV